MAELQFRVDDAAVTALANTPINANFKELSTALTNLNEEYRAVIYTDDEIPDAKKELARLRKLQKSINDYKIFVSKQAGKPLEDFKQKVKGLIAILDESVNNLDGQIKQSEQRIREEKIFKIHNYFDNADNAYPEYATWDYCYNERWELKSYSIDTAYADIDETIARIATEIKTIKSLRSEHEIALLDHYKQSHEIISTLALNERLIEQKAQREEAERRRQERLAEIEQERLRQEAIKKTTPPTEPEDNAMPEQTAEVVQDEPEHYVGTFRVYGTYEEFMMLRQFMNRNGIQHTFEGMTATDEPYDVALCRSDWK